MKFIKNKLKVTIFIFLFMFLLSISMGFAQTMPGITLTASSELSADYSAANAADGKVGTIWATKLNSTPEWIYADLGAPKKINGIGLKWFDEYYAKKYQVFISDDLKKWTKVADLTNAAPGDDIIKAAPDVFVEKRYIGIYMMTANSVAFALSEFEVYEYMDPATPTPTPTATLTPTPTAVITPPPNNMLTNGDFSNALTGWDAWADAQLNGAATFEVVGGQFKATITNGGTELWAVGLLQENLVIENGVEYVVTFDAKADAARTMQASVAMSKDPWAVYSKEEIINLTTTLKPYAFSFTMGQATDNAAVLEFDMGKLTGTITMDNIVLNKKGQIPTPTPTVTPTPTGPTATPTITPTPTSGGGVITKQLPSKNPPKGFPVNNVPQLVTIGFDDNSRSGDAWNVTYPQSMRWILNFMKTKKNPAGTGNLGTFDGTDARVSFFNNSTYMANGAVDGPNLVKRSFNEAYTDGHEVGNHSDGHPHGSAFSVGQWVNELQVCEDWHTKPVPPDTAQPWDQTPNNGAGIPKSDFVGFRTPFLECNDGVFGALEQLGYLYDCSIEDGYQYDQNGTNYYWPYTLDEGGSDGWDILVEMSQNNPYVPDKFPLTAHPGLWELPNPPVIVPPDEKCAEYGIPTGLRAKMKQAQSWFDEASGKITGFDYNLWISFKMTKDELAATLKYTLDLRLQGNRSPFMFGAHSQYYDETYSAPPSANCLERQQAIEEFIDYALTKPDVRIVPAKDIIEYCRNPVMLK